MRNIFLRTACLGLLAFLPAHPVHAQGTPAAFAAPAASAARLDFSDYSSSTITNKAWGALSARNHEAAIAYTSKCIEMFKGKAVEMQKVLTAAPTDKDQTFAQWALNDVGTCYYLRAKAYEAKASKRRRSPTTSSCPTILPMPNAGTPKVGSGSPPRLPGSVSRMRRTGR